MSAEVSKRTAAEARRQKLLARGTDRLQQITQGKPQKTSDTQAPVLYEPQARAESSSTTQAADVPLLTADKSLTRSQSLPQEATRPLAGQAEDCSAEPDLETKPEGRPEQQEQPRSPPPNTLWNTPRASDRENSRSESSKAFTFSTEKPKLEAWAKYDKPAACASGESGQIVHIKRISWHQAPSPLILHLRQAAAALLHSCGRLQTFYMLLQAVAAAVQTTHLLRLLTAVALVMVLRSAKSVMYSGKEVSSWQQAVVHVYDLPPMVLLLLLQLSAIALPAKMYHDTPSTVPQKVLQRVTAAAASGSGGLSSTVRKGVMLIAPSLLNAHQQLGTARVTTRAVLDGTCVYLFAGMLCHLINES